MATNNSVLHPAADVQARLVEDGAVLVDLRSGAVYQLNRVGSEVWSLMCAGATIESICDTVAERYGIPIDQASADVQTLLASLTRAGLVAAETMTGTR